MIQKQALLDKLSEFLMVEQAGYQLYTVLAMRTQVPEYREKYVEFGDETSRHREILASMIQQLGGDPGYVSPLARIAQMRGEHMLGLAIEADGLGPEEIEAVGLECVLLAETKDHADWQLLSKLAQQLPQGQEREAMIAAVAEVEEQEDQHVGWAHEQCSMLAMRMLLEEPAPPPERWQSAWTGPHYTPEMHPAPMEAADGLLKPAQAPTPWGPSPIERSLGPSPRRGKSRSGAIR